MNTGRFSIISNQVTRQEIDIIITECQKALAFPGDVVEFGCYVGTTSLFLQRQLQSLAPNRQLHVYDSFAGLPAKKPEDISPVGEQFVQGELLATKTQFIKNFKQANLPLPIIHKGWFEELLPKDLPEKVCFAFLDGDFYSSIFCSLKLVWPHLTDGSIVVVDDYHTEALPGVRRAVDDWLKGHGATVQIHASLAIIKPAQPAVVNRRGV